MTEAMILPQPDGADVEDAVDPESDISGTESRMETDEKEGADYEDVNLDYHRPWSFGPIDDEYRMPFQPENFVQDPAPVNRPNINASPIEYFDYFTTDEENNANLIDILVTETNRYAEQSIQQPLSSYSRINDWIPTDRAEMRAFIGVMMAM